MNPIAMLIMGAAYGYMAGNPQARRFTLKQIQKFSGMAIDGLSKQGGNNVQKTITPIEQPEKPEE